MNRALEHVIPSVSTIFLLFAVAACTPDDAATPPQTSEPEPALFKPELFGVNFATDDDNRHSSLAFSPDGVELFYSVYVDNKHPQKIFSSRQENGVWTEPSLAPFSGTFTDGGPIFSRDGEHLYFYSRRPVAPSTDANDDYDIWYVDRTTGEWSEPRRMGVQINTDGHEQPNAFSSNGDFYFSRRTPDARLTMYKAAAAGEGRALLAPQPIKELSDQASFLEPVAIDGEDFFIYTNNVKKGRFYYTALFISHRNADGSWSRPKDMGDMINSGEGRFPSLSPDGRHLYFLSYRSGISQFYRVDASIIDYLKTEDLDLVQQLTTVALAKELAPVEEAYHALLQKHVAVYHFDEVLLNEVASNLISADATDSAIDVYRFNFELYPNTDFYPQQLVIALLEDDAEAFDDLTAQIRTESSVIHQGILDDLNMAGEIFLRNGRPYDAIRIFKLNAGINPESTWPSYKLGKAYYQLEDHANARRSFRQAMQLDPNNQYASNYLEEIEFPVLSGPYLGQAPPGMTPEKFASGVLTPDDGDIINSVFSPDGTEFYYVFLEDRAPRYHLWFTRVEDGVWSEPRPLLASDEYSVADIALSPDGDRLYFCSDMPTYWDDAEGFDIWYIERTDIGWSEPVNTGRNINTRGGETQPSFTTDGTMYFPSWTNSVPDGDVDIFRAANVEGDFSERIPLQGGVNSNYNEGNAFVAPDGSYILFARWGMPESIDGGKALYISFRNTDGSWGEAINTEPVLKVKGSLAALSHDGKYLLWSTRQGLHWVDVRALDKLRSVD